MGYLLDSKESVLLVIDIQEKFRQVVSQPEALIAKSRQLIEAASLLDIPIVVSEQYPKGLGHTVSELLSALPSNTPVFEKTSFGCYDDSQIQAHLKKLNRKQIVVCGLETHVCVNQTVCRLLEENFQVYIVQDAVSSRSEENYNTALQKMRHFGVIASCVEMVLFEWMRDATHPKFKEVQALIK